MLRHQITLLRFQSAAAVLTLCAAALSAPHAARPTDSGMVRIASIPSLGANVVPPARIVGDGSSAAPASQLIIAVVDTGVDPDATGLAGRVLPGYNALDGGSDTGDDNGHGTQVAAILLGLSESGMGGAPCTGCEIYPVKALAANGSGTFDQLADGIVHATDAGARVINLSVAGPHGSPALQAAIAYAVQHGAIVVAAAGNAGSDDPDGCSSVTCGGYPAAYPGVLSVAAEASPTQLLPSSNHGSWVDVAAPGCALTPGGSTAVCGTSIAAPFVAALAAVAEADSGVRDGAAIQEAIESSATRTGLDVRAGSVAATSALVALGVGRPAGRRHAG